jgi:proton-coupled amino acid transporter
MAESPQGGSSSPQAIGSSRRDSDAVFGGASPSSRSYSTARLASPVPVGTPPIRQIPTPRQLDNANDDYDDDQPLPGASYPRGSIPGPGPSSLSQALRGGFAGSPPRFASPAPPAPAFPDNASYSQSPNKNEDLEVLRRHLVGPSHQSPHQNIQPSASYQRASNFPEIRNSVDKGPGIDDDHFSSLQLQGGDMTRHIYRYTEEREREEVERHAREKGRLTRSLSVSLPRPNEEDPELNNIKMPGGLRRDYIRRTAASPAPEARVISRPNYGSTRAQTEPPARQQPQFLANNFIEFLTLYGHFAGESLEDDDEALGPDEYFSSEAYDDDDDRDDREGEWGEDSALLTPGKRKRRRKEQAGKGSPGGAALLLLKSFVGTGVLFLPRAYLNGGMMFSNLVLLGIASLSFWCFILLVNTRLAVHASFGDMGGKIYGNYFRNLINFSLVISQIGFSSAYIVFVSENLQAFVLAVTDCRTFIDIKYMILMQMIVFLPLSLYRNINNIQKLALLADLFIVLGLVYLYYYDILTLVNNHGIADIIQFNKDDWTLFIGTAIFTFEGIGLIIPIQSGMKDPRKFPKVLGGVMIAVTIVFVSMGALSYAAYGSATKTVIILNMPQDNRLVNSVQFIYSLAILLSTPLQIYPAIEITSQQLFSRTGKYNPWIKWKKNVFRFFMVMLCAVIAWAGAGQLDKFVALVGSFACIPLVFVYPVSHLHQSSVLLLLLTPHDSLLCTTGPSRHVHGNE